MTEDLQRRQIDMNYTAFQTMLPGLLAEQKNEYALMRDSRIVAFYDNPGDADRAGMELFVDSLYSIQEVTDEPIDLGIYSMFPDLLCMDNGVSEGFEAVG